MIFLKDKMMEFVNNWISIFYPWFLKHGIKILLIGISAYILNKVLVKIITKAVRVAVVPDSTMSPESEKKREDTLISILNGALRIMLMLVALLMILAELGLEIAPILAGAGIVGLALGFGGQYLIRDLISGLFIIIENQYRIGDVININGTGGLVEDITLRKTTLRDLNGTVHHIPHGEVKIVSNFSKNFARINLDIGVAYNSNIDHVIDVINKTGVELTEDTEFKDFIVKPPEFLRVEDFADSAIIIKILGETTPLKQWLVTGELRKRLKAAFDKEGIEIPFPQRVIHNAKTEIN